MLKLKLLCAVVLVCAVGCSGGMPWRRTADSSAGSSAKTGLASWLPSKKKHDGPYPNLTTPHQRVEALEELAKEARHNSVEEQARISTELARSLQSEEDALIRTHMIRTLSAFDTQVAMAALTASLNDPEADVRIAVCEGLAKRGNPESIRLLSSALASDTDIDVRLAAARALGETGDPAAMQALSVALEEDDPAMQYRVVKSLRQLAPKDLGDDVPAWREYLASGAPPPTKTASLWDRIRKPF